MDTFNTIDYGLDRTRQELEEARHAHKNETPWALLFELIDVQIFVHSLMARVADELDIEPAHVDRMIEIKMARNHEKYDEAFFNNGYDTGTAITMARHWHNLGLSEERFGNDVY
ncbi:hypothetical protein [Polynucleobacter sp.]|uniref:hypothetical protein n=1 Tax=Polynucleobacter sp. TaxID=2029855 RepID=UPI003F69CA93